MSPNRDHWWCDDRHLGSRRRGSGYRVIPLTLRPAARARLSLIPVRARFRRDYHAVEVTSGALVIISVLVFTGRMTWLSSQLGFLNRFVL